MAKKKKSVELSDQNITFSIETRDYKIIRFYPSSMSLDVMEYRDGKKCGATSIPFAHLPKNIKAIIKPKR